MNKFENQVDQSTQSSLVLQYDDQFPPLPSSIMPKYTHYSKPRSTAIVNHKKSATVTQTLVVPLAERRFSPRDISSHNDAQKKICQNVAQKCGVSIELNAASLKDQNLSLFINGTPDNVLSAKKMLTKELQTQTQLQLKVPKEYHKFILGRSGTSLREIENNSSTNVTLPRATENSDLVTIVGTKEGIERARLDIVQIVNERSKLATEKLLIPRRFYPFITGPNNVKVNQIRELTNVKINIPPPQSESEEIVIFGEKEGVFNALAMIEKLYNNVKNSCSTLNLPIPKSQHRYVIGPKGAGITEILEKTGVSVEIPVQESSEDTIVLFGPNEQLAPALSLVIQKSESMMAVTLDAPNWLHRFIIGKSGNNLNKLLENYERVFINFQEDSDHIVMEGPKEDVKELRTVIEDQIEELKRTMASVELHVDQRFHRHIIGRNGTNIQRMQDEYKVQIRMPGNSGSVIRIEGDPSGVLDAKAEIESMSLKLENEKTKDVILDHKYHNQLIGSNGARIKELRTLFPDVQITFPDSSLKCDIVQCRGPRQQVDQVALKLNKLIEEVIENNYVTELRILKQYHKNIIGKGGANVRRIRDECQVRVDFPDEQSGSDIVRLTGKKNNVKEAAKKMEAMQAELVSIKEDSIVVPHKLHTALIGVRGKLIRCVQDECGGVIVLFPPSESQLDTIRIRGVEADVDKAKKMLLDLAEKNQLLTYEEPVNAKAEYHKYLIGRKGTQMAEFRRRHSVMVIFPDNEDVNKDLIHIVGAKEAVQKARAELEATIKSMENEVELVMSVDPKWHKHFFMKRQAVLDDLSREFGGVRVFFPRQDAVEKVDQVRVVGPKGCVEAAIIRVNDIVANLEAQTTILVFIEQKHHRLLINRNMTEIKAIQSEFEVTIKFPSKPENSAAEESFNGHVTNGHNTEDTIDTVVEDPEENNPANLVAISGTEEHCQQAKEALLELVPVIEEVPLANDLHRNLIGQKGQGINTFSSRYNVIVNIAQANKAVDYISMKGTLSNIAQAKIGLAELVEQWDKDKQDRIARNFELSVDVPVAYHRQIIGQRGANIEMFRNKYNVNIQIPDQSSGSSTIVIRGYDEDANRAGEELCAIVSRLEAQVREELHIPREVHPLLIGTRGVNLKRLREQFKVEINFPNRNGDVDRGELVEVIGDKSNVDECCDHLVERANELLEEFEERSQSRGGSGSGGVSVSQCLVAPLTQRHPHNAKAQPGFMLAGAPWQQRVPDTLSNEDFPTMDNIVDKTCLYNGHIQS